MTAATMCDRCTTRPAKHNTCPGDGASHGHGRVHTLENQLQAVCEVCIKDVEDEWVARRAEHLPRFVEITDHDVQFDWRRATRELLEASYLRSTHPVDRQRAEALRRRITTDLEVYDAGIGE